MIRKEYEYSIDYTPKGRKRPVIDLNKPGYYFGDPKLVRINWSACGDVTVEEAIAFRDALNAAIEDALRLTSEAA